MSQTREGNAGYRAKPNGRSHPAHPAGANRARRGQRPSRSTESGPSQDASIIKTRSLKFLVDTVGAENIALGLESSMTRIAELMRGERFTPETAFHMETALGLPSGFFDQHYPALSPEIIARLQSPLERVDAEETSEEADDKPAPHVLNPKNPSLGESRLFQEARMRSKSFENAPGTAKTLSAKTFKGVSGPENQAAAGDSFERGSLRQAAQREQADSGGKATVENIRQANLHVLTGRNGSKVKLGAVMGLTGSNMAHRLHGKKRMDDAEAERFTERLGLPRGWLDTPRSEAEIPESVTLLLTPASRARVPVQADRPTADAPTVAAARKAADISQTTGTLARDNLQAVGLTTDAPSKEESVMRGQHEEVNDAITARPRGPIDSIGHQVLSAVATPVEPPTAPVIPHGASTPSALLVPTSLDGLGGIAPIAEALLKTLAGKARTGRLDEMKALELLQQAVLL